MAKRSKKRDRESATHLKPELRYREARRLAEKGQHARARRLYQRLDGAVPGAPLRALVKNDLATLAAIEGDALWAQKTFKAALAIDPSCEPARLNLAMLEADSATVTKQRPRHESSITLGPPAATIDRKSDIVACPEQKEPIVSHATASGDIVADRGRLGEPGAGPVKVAILSFLFNWPSTGGGIVHTVELAHFLAKAGYQVRHFYARYPAWGVGQVTQKLAIRSEAIDFDCSTWNVPTIQDRFRNAVDSFGPDYAIITDSWNSKPLLAEAVGGYRYILRFQAMECLCPLNNVRLLPTRIDRFEQCHRHQLATPDQCCACLRDRGRLSGSLHQAERALCEVGTRVYHDRLLRVLREAEAVLVVNPLIEAMVAPFASNVRVVTAGMDPARFPWPWPEQLNSRETRDDDPESNRSPLAVFFAGLVEEPMKGFGVLHQACAMLRQRRRDFELVATADPAGQVDDFTRFVGWLSQEELPRHLRCADVCVVPTIAQEALGRTAVEAMAVGRPVVASRLGGLPFTVADGATGLLCEPGNPQDLARKLETLLDDPALRERMGPAGRRRFEDDYSWDVIIQRHYRPLLGSPSRRANGAHMGTRS